MIERATSEGTKVPSRVNPSFFGVVRIDRSSDQKQILIEGIDLNCDNHFGESSVVMEVVRNDAAAVKASSISKLEGKLIMFTPMYEDTCNPSLMNALVLYRGINGKYQASYLSKKTDLPLGTKLEWLLSRFKNGLKSFKPR